MFYLFCLSSSILLKANSWPRCRRLIFSLLINRLCFKFINAGDRIFEHIFVSANICLSVTGKEIKTGMTSKFWWSNCFSASEMQAFTKTQIVCLFRQLGYCFIVTPLKVETGKKFRDFEWGRDRVFFSTSSVAPELNQTKLCVIAAL